MNTRRLIDSLVQQTTVLIAQLATTAGVRAPLSHVANRVFLDLAQAIEAQGVSRKVAADMFGLALRSYQLKVQRLAQSATEDAESLWQAIYEYISSEEIVSRQALLSKFHDDDEATVKAVLHDLVENGLLFQTGQGDRTAYRAATLEEVQRMDEDASLRATPMVAWITIYKHGHLSESDLGQILNEPSGEVQAVLLELLEEGKIRVEDRDGELVYSSNSCVIPMSEPAGWEAAVFDHFNALVVALSLKLRQVELRSEPDDRIGGSTYSFALYDGHPLEEEVLGLLSRTRKEVSELRKKVSAHNEDTQFGSTLVTFYFGQSLIVDEESA